MTARPRIAITREEMLDVVLALAGCGLIVASAFGALPRWLVGLGAVVALHSAEKLVTSRTGRRLAREPALVTEDCDPRGKVEIEGRVWKATAWAGAPIKAGRWARVRGATWVWSGLLLEVEPAAGTESVEIAGRLA